MFKTNCELCRSLESPTLLPSSIVSPILYYYSNHLIQRLMFVHAYYFEVCFLFIVLKSTVADIWAVLAQMFLDI